MLPVFAALRQAKPRSGARAVRAPACCLEPGHKAAIALLYFYSIVRRDRGRVRQAPKFKSEANMRKLILAMALALALGAASSAHAVAIAVFDNPIYIDTGGSGTSSGALQALLLGQGYAVSTFTGTSAADFNAAAGAADLLLFPDMLNFGALASDLDTTAKSALAAYVAGGGGLITAGGFGHRLLNAIFYPTCDFVSVFCFASSGSISGSERDDAVAGGTPYAAGPAALGTGQSEALNPFAFTPLGGLNLYRDLVGGFPNSTTVLTAPIGSGSFGYLAWGLAGATPGTAGGWDQVLDTMVQDVAEPAAVPIPGSLWLVAPLFLLLALRHPIR
jgi:hypothetical protein